MERIYRIGTRRSPLALKQAEEIINKLSQRELLFKTTTIGIDSFGDKDKSTPISDIEGTDFFTDEIDKALLENKIDIAIHSAKDLPDYLSKELYIAAITKSIDQHDVFISKSKKGINDIHHGATIGTSSVRRKLQLKKYRKDLNIVDIRGNIEERLNKLYSSNLDAIVIARAGLIRLGLEDRITEELPFDVMRPHPLQGALACVVRKNDVECLNMLKMIDEREKIRL